MRRGIGVSAFKNRQNDQQKYSAMGKELETSKLSSVKVLLSDFQAALMQFATKHRTRINSDPEFRVQFHSMCLSAGVDPLASNKEICLKTRAQNGGLIPITDLLDRIRSSSKGGSIQTISTADIIRAVEKLTVLGKGFRIVDIMGNSMVLSLPIELNKDHEEIIKEVQDAGSVTEMTMTITNGWSIERFDIAIRPLLQDGIIWVDDFKGERFYLLPSLFK